MTTLALRATLTAVMAAAPWNSVGNLVFAEPTSVPATVEDGRLLPYVKAGRLVDIGGRRINLLCNGTGGPTVVLMAGSSSWSFTWYKAQPEIAKRERVCAFDRAGYGFSDPAPTPEILSDSVNDLHAALRAAELRGPYVLVGHSLGGLEARLFAQRWPHEVGGMVLVDTSPAAELLMEVNQPYYDSGDSMEEYTSKVLKCVLLEARGRADLTSPENEHCLIGPMPADTPEVLRKMWPSFFTADHAAAQLSLISSLFTHRYDSADHLHLGDMPLVVLSADTGWNMSGPAATFWRTYRKRWFALHEALAQLSSRGVHRVIEHSRHQIQLDKPQAVVDAVDQVRRELEVANASNEGNRRP
jgi:pimeloyl-ACP methyl ester carboxylesterase